MNMYEHDSTWFNMIVTLIVCSYHQLSLFSTYGSTQLMCIHTVSAYAWSAMMKIRMRLSEAATHCEVTRGVADSLRDWYGDRLLTYFGHIQPTILGYTYPHIPSYPHILGILGLGIIIQPAFLGYKLGARVFARVFVVGASECDISKNRWSV